MNIKTIVMFLGMLIPLGSISAQHSLQKETNAPRSGDSIIKQQVEYKNPGRSGDNVLWDFSQLKVVDDEYGLTYSTPDDTIITGTEHSTNYHYVLQNDSLVLLGFDNQTTQLCNIQPEVLLKFPFQFGDTTGSYFYAHGKYGNRLEMDVMGSTQTVGDAYGMMILPSKDTLKQVLRTHTLKHIAENSIPISSSYFEKLKATPIICPDSINRRLASDTVLFIIETFRWYEKGYRYPVFETVRSWELYRHSKEYTFLSTAFFYPPQEHYYLNDDLENQALLEDKKQGKPDKPDPWFGLTYNIYPNPVHSESLQIELYLPKATNVRIQVSKITGQSVLNANKGNHPAGACHFEVNITGLPVGNYALTIGLSDKVIKETLMKR